MRRHAIEAIDRHMFFDLECCSTCRGHKTSPRLVQGSQPVPHAHDIQSRIDQIYPARRQNDQDVGIGGQPTQNQIEPRTADCEFSERMTGWLTGVHLQRMLKRLDQVAQPLETIGIRILLPDWRRDVGDSQEGGAFEEDDLLGFGGLPKLGQIVAHQVQVGREALHYIPPSEV